MAVVLALGHGQRQRDAGLLIILLPPFLRSTALAPGTNAGTGSGLGFATDLGFFFRWSGLLQRLYDIGDDNRSDNRENQ